MRRLCFFFLDRLWSREELEDELELELKTLRKQHVRSASLELLQTPPPGTRLAPFTKLKMKTLMTLTPKQDMRAHLTRRASMERREAKAWPNFKLLTMMSLEGSSWTPTAVRSRVPLGAACES